MDFSSLDSSECYMHAQSFLFFHQLLFSPLTGSKRRREFKETLRYLSQNTGPLFCSQSSAPLSAELHSFNCFSMVRRSDEAVAPHYIQLNSALIKRFKQNLLLTA